MHVLEQPGPQLRYTEVVHRHETGLQHLAYRVLGDHGQAEEVVQDSLHKLADDPVLGRPDGEIAAWLRRVTINGAYNRMRTERRARDRTERAARLEPTAAAEGTTPLTEVIAAEERDLVRRVLAGLPARQRALLLLRASGCSYAEIAATVDVAAGSIGTLLARAERAFRSAYETTAATLGDPR